ncbi:MAG: glycosyltransferase [Flavobacteriaceae bacterium]|nr:glycosyltransferase [Flavobacteriaceae bacterium]
MKILHLIDSLNPGGAERMAVGYVNALADREFEVYLWSSREEGLLKNSIQPRVHYHFLNRKGPVGIKALQEAIHLIKKEKIQLIHAHTTSYVFGTLLKLFCPNIKLIWHDHHGNRSQSKANRKKSLVLCSRYFDAVFTVNQTLKDWHQKHLKTQNIFYIPNFVSQPSIGIARTETNSRAHTIVCVANLRMPKNHINLINAFAEVYKSHPEWKLQLIGKVKDDDYSQILRSLIAQFNMEDAVSIMGEQVDVYSFLNKAGIGVLSSDIEGMPMSLLEYALARLPVVCTDVGYCSEVVQGYGKVVPPGDSNALAEALLFYIQNPDMAAADAAGLQKHVEGTYTAQAVLPDVIEIYRRLLQA